MGDDDECGNYLPNSENIIDVACMKLSRNIVLKASEVGHNFILILI